MLAGRRFRLDEDGATQVFSPLLHYATGCTTDQNGNVYFVNMWTTTRSRAPKSGNVVKFNQDDKTLVTTQQRSAGLPEHNCRRRP